MKRIANNRYSHVGKLLVEKATQSGSFFSKEFLKRQIGRNRIGKTMQSAKIAGYPLVFKFASRKHPDMRVIFDYTKWVYDMHAKNKIKPKRYSLVEPPLIYAEKDTLVMAHAPLTNIRDVLHPEIIENQYNLALSSTKKNPTPQNRKNLKEAKRRIELTNEFKKAYPKFDKLKLELAKTELIKNMNILQKKTNGIKLDNKLSNILIAGIERGKFKFIIIDQPQPNQGKNYIGLPEKMINALK